MQTGLRATHQDFTTPFNRVGEGVNAVGGAQIASVEGVSTSSDTTATVDNSQCAPNDLNCLQATIQDTPDTNDLQGHGRWVGVEGRWADVGAGSLRVAGCRPASLQHWPASSPGPCLPQPRVWYRRRHHPRRRTAGHHPPRQGHGRRRQRLLLRHHRRHGEA